LGWSLRRCAVQRHRAIGALLGVRDALVADTSADIELRGHGHIAGEAAVNWRRYLTRQEKVEITRCDRELRYFAERMATIRGMRKRIQNRAYVRGKK